MMVHDTKYGRKKDEAIAALLSQRTIEEAARSIGTSPKTLLRWMRVPEVKAAYNEARGQAMGQSNARLQQAAKRSRDDVVDVWEIAATSSLVPNPNRRSTPLRFVLRDPRRC
jgi:hypothetical protein